MEPRPRRTPVTTTTESVDLTKVADPADPPATTRDGADNKHRPGRRPDGTADLDLLADDVDELGDDVDELEEDLDRVRGRVAKLRGQVRALNEVVGQRSGAGHIWRWVAVAAAWLVAGMVVAVMLLASPAADFKTTLENIWVPLVAAAVATFIVAISD